MVGPLLIECMRKLSIHAYLAALTELIHRHYAMCPHVYAFCNYFFEADPCPLCRIGLKAPSIRCLQVLSCVFSAYHALKGHVSANGELNMQENTGNVIHLHWSLFAQSLSAEAG